MVLNFNVFTKTLPSIDWKSIKVVNTINPHSYCVSKTDKEFEAALKASDILLPDGVGIVWAARLLKGKKIQKIAGFDLFIYLMRQLEQQKGSCFFLGASQQTLDLIKERASKEFPNVEVYSFSPPYKPTFSKEESVQMYDKINDVKPNVVFVGMTAPKQEKWVFQNSEMIQADIVCSIGAVFDFYAGTVKRPNKFWIKLGLEWLPRFLKEPRRLAERNLVSTPKFMLEVISFKFFGKGFL